MNTIRDLRFLSRTRLLTAALSLLFAGTSFAIPVSYSFTGYVTEFNYEGSSFNPSSDQEIAGILKYDANYDGLFFGEPWPTSSATLYWELQLDGESYRQDIMSPLVQSISSSGNRLTFADEMPGMSFGAAFFDQSILGLSFSTDLMGLIPAGLPTASFLYGWFSFGGGTGGSNQGATLQGTIDSITQIPEPAPFLLFVIGLAGITIAGRIRRTNQPALSTCKSNRSGD